MKNIASPLGIPATPTLAPFGADHNAWGEARPQVMRGIGHLLGGLQSGIARAEVIGMVETLTATADNTLAPAEVVREARNDLAALSVAGTALHVMAGIHHAAPNLPA